ncbi:MAG: glycosyltransferase family 4 protein [Bacteroidota bacterium]
MRILLQNPHTLGELSGVVTYLDTLEAELARRGVETAVLRSKSASLADKWRAVQHADVVHLNANDLALALMARLRGRTTVQKYHFAPYRSTFSDYTPMGFRQRLWTEWKLNLYRPFAPSPTLRYSVKAAIHLAGRLSVMALMHHIVACSGFIAEACSFPRPVHVIYNPMPVEPGQAARTLEALPTPFRFVYAGHLSKHKGPDLLIDAVRTLTSGAASGGVPFEVRMIGDGQHEAGIRQLAKLTGVEHCVTFLGRLSHAEVLAEMREALAVVVPSRCQEAASYASIEGASQQVMTIGTRVGGLPETAGPDALIVPPNDPQALAMAMTHVLNAPAEALERGRRAYERALEVFDAGRVAEQFLDVVAPSFSLQPV